MVFPTTQHWSPEGAPGQVFGLCEDRMSAGSLPSTHRTCRENILVVEGLKRQDAELLDHLIVQHQERLLRYLLYLTGDRETAEDLFQETWMRVLMRGSQFRGDSSFATWLFSIARNLAIDTCRGRRTVSSLDAMCESDGESRPFEVADEGPSPFDRYQTQESAQRLAEALFSLEPRQREVLILRFHEGLSLEEIAQVTRASLSTAKSRLYRSLAALKPRILAREQPTAPQCQPWTE
jgi:RNA polymerase sigma-70 factor (ECF subfamily)